MGYIPEEAIEEVRGRADIVATIGEYVSVQKRGGDYWCCCPFHKEKTPSFKINAAMGMYHCFGCGASGNLYTFVMAMENVDFPAAVRLLARQTGVHIPEALPLGKNGAPADREITKDTVLEVLGKTADWFRRQLDTPEASKASEYLAARGIDRDTIARFGIGYAPDRWDALLNWGNRQSFSPKLMVAAGLLAEKEREGEGENRLYDRFRGRVMFPIWDELGRVAGFSGRVLDAEAKTAKYVNSPETVTFHKGRLLYCLNIARKAFKDSGAALICEGQLDVIACHRAGLTYAVAPQGTAFTDEQAKLLRRHTENVVFAFDADAAGVKAAVRSLEVALQADLKVKVVSMPEGEDPDGIFAKRGAEALAEVMANPQDAFEFLFDTAAQDHDLASPNGKQGIVSQILEIVLGIPQPVARAALCQWLAGKLQLPESSIFDSLNLMLKKRRRTDGFRRPDAPRSRAASPPPFHPQAPVREDVASEPRIASALENLFDLALHHKPIAERLAQNEHLAPEMLGGGNIERALLLILQKTVEEEWEESGKAIARDTALASDPLVVRLMNRSRFAYPDEEDLTEMQKKRRWARIEAAATDCARAIESCHLEKRERELKAAMASCNPEETVTLMRDLHTIGRQKKHLHPTCRPQ